MPTSHANRPSSTSVVIPVGNLRLEGELQLPVDAPGVVLFANSSGSSRHSPRNQFVDGFIRDLGIGTLLFDLMTLDEERLDAGPASLRFDIPLLTHRLISATRWIQKEPRTRHLKIGYFASSTGSAAALMAAAELGDQIAAVVSQGGRPDLAGDALPNVKCPTLFVVGGYDETVICLNGDALARMRCPKSLRIVPSATHLFEEPGRLEQAAQISANWFHKHMSQPES
jgi:putative phosphoribosyl transferase